MTAMSCASRLLLSGWPSLKLRSSDHSHELRTDPHRSGATVELSSLLLAAPPLSSAQT